MRLRWGWFRGFVSNFLFPWCSQASKCSADSSNRVSSPHLDSCLLPLKWNADQGACVNSAETHKVREMKRFLMAWKPPLFPNTFINPWPGIKIHLKYEQQMKSFTLAPWVGVKGNYNGLKSAEIRSWNHSNIIIKSKLALSILSSYRL